MADPVESSIDGRVALLRLNRPQSGNALTPELTAPLAAELERLDPDPEVRCIVIAGAERVFAAGADVEALGARDAEPPHRPAASLWRRLAATETPLIAAVSGFALGGGCELALACDMIVASETARFGQPEITLGFIPGGGGAQRLARVLGKQLAMEYVLTGRQFDANMALEMGLVNRVAKKRSWLQEAMELAHTVAARPPIAARLGKQAVLAAEETTLSAGLEGEARLYEIAAATEDRVEGIRAFLEKREPKFEGR